jgi:A/G-specific adenine glycosylase
MELSQEQRNEFLEVLWGFYGRHGRDLPWRVPEPDGSFDLYKVMVSELMLQQTQVTRVVPKYREFLKRFPTVERLASAELGEVLRAWQGLGYNRRAKFLWQAARAISSSEQFPATIAALVKLPGIGVNTAGAIFAYGYNQPTLFVETNVRTVYIHHFFLDRTDVADKEIITVLAQTLDREQPREFYGALMDYGTYLKATVGNLNKTSKHYVKQAAFGGSRRQLRGQVMRILGEDGYTLSGLRAVITDDRLESVLNDLVTEGLVQMSHGTYTL